MTKRHTKRRSNIKVVEVDKDYAGTESSPYREWLEEKGDANQEHELAEPMEANPDVLSESANLYYQAPCEDSRLELIYMAMEVLSDRQKEILRMCGNEGRTIENCAAILGISRATVQKALIRIREKISAIQKRDIHTYKREGTA